MTKSFSFWTLFFSVLLAASAGLVIIQGETPWAAVWQGAWLRLSGISSDWNPLLDERLPRLIVIVCTGASLAVSGAVMQALFQNPLASPSVLGVSSGGTLITIVIFILDWHLTYPYALPLAAVLGSLFTLCLVYSLSKAQGGGQLTSLVLIGIAVSTILIAIHSLLLYAMRDHWQLIQTITEWEAGSTLDRNWQHVHMQLPLTLVGLGGCWFYRQEMNMLALGEEEAKNLGLDVKTVRWRLFLSVSLLTGGVLAAVGVIAFFGLILPHLLRSLCGPNYRPLILLCMVGGASTLAFLDLLLRFFSIYAISVGNFSAVIGGFCFLLLLFRTQHKPLVSY